MDDVTVVSFLFDLSTRESDRPRKMAEYLTLGQNLLSLPVNLYLIADPELVPSLKRYRELKGLAEKTVIRAIPLEATSYCRYYPKVDKHFTDGRFPEGLSKVKDSAWYHLISWTKFWVIGQALTQNPFNSTKFVWLDFGIFHLYRNQESSIQNFLIKVFNDILSDKVRIMVIRETYPSDIADRSEYYSKYQWRIGEGFFSGDHQSMTWYCQAFERELDNCLATGRPNLEGAIMGAIYAENKGRFSVYYGCYFDLITSYFRPLDSFRLARDNLSRCQEQGLWKEGLDYILPAWEAIDRGGTVPAPDQLFHFYDEALTISWYAGEGKLSGAAGQRMLNLYDHVRHNVTGDNWTRIKNNLALHNLLLPEEDS